VVKTDEPVPASIEGLIKLRPVSMSGHTFLEYTTSFSNDVSAERIEDQKWKKLELFKSLIEAVA